MSDQKGTQSNEQRQRLAQTQQLIPGQKMIGLDQVLAVLAAQR